MRALSQLEEALTITNATYPLSAVCVLRLDKGPSEQALQSSLDRLQKYYPFLQAFIIEKNGQYWFEKDINERSVQLKVVQRKDDNQWLEFARRELNLGFDHSSPPLMRAIYLNSTSTTEKSEIILSFHHAIMDSVSLLSFLDHFLTMGGEEETKLDNLFTTPSKPLTPSPLLRDVLPPTYRMPRLLFRLLPFISRQLKNERVYKKSTGIVKDSPIPASSENHILTLSFSEEETVSLIKWSRKEKLSLNSIIVATMLIVVNHHNYNGRKKMLRTVQFANLRPYLKPPVGKNVEGSFIAMMRFDIPLSQETAMIQVAKQIDEQIRESAKRGDKFLFSLLSKILIKKSFRAKKERLSATALSYAGPLQLKKQYGHIVVSDIHGFITNNCLGPELSGFGKICFNRLSLDLNFLSAETHRDKALTMTRELKSRLLQLISE